MPNSTRPLEQIEDRINARHAIMALPGLTDAVIDWLADQDEADLHEIAAAGRVAAALKLRVLLSTGVMGRGVCPTPAEAALLLSILADTAQSAGAL